MTKAAPTFYILHGDDDLRIGEEVDKIRARMGDGPNAELNISQFDGSSVEVGEVIAAATAYPFLADKRLVIVRSLLQHLGRKGAGQNGKKGLEKLAEVLPTLPDWTRLVFVEHERLDDKHKLIALARQHEGGFEKLFTVPKDTTDWIIKRAQTEYSAKIDPRAAAALASVTPGDLRRADNELYKLACYVDNTRPIVEADVLLLTPYVAESTMFEMVDALAEGRGKVAAEAIINLLEQQQDVFALYGMIVRQFRLLLLAKEHLTTGGHPGTIAQTLNVHRYSAEKLARQTRNFSLAQLEAIYRKLQEYDEKMKTGKIDARLALDLLVATLSG